MTEVTFVVSFDRIGRYGDPDPLTVTVPDGHPAVVCARLVDAVRAYAGPLCPTIRIDAAVNKPLPRHRRVITTADLDGVAGFVLDGARIAGRYIAEIIDPDRLTGVGA